MMSSLAVSVNELQCIAPTALQDALTALDDERRRGRDAEAALMLKAKEAEDAAEFQVPCLVF